MYNNTGNYLNYAAHPLFIYGKIRYVLFACKEYFILLFNHKLIYMIN